MFRTQKTRSDEKALADALDLWKKAGDALELARRRFDAAENSFETEAAIFEMGSAEARRSKALCEIRNITMARDIAQSLSEQKASSQR